MNNEWSLIFFTLLVQLCVGVILLFSFIYFLAGADSIMPAIEKLKFPEFPIIIIIGLAVIVSLLHLGSPKNSIHSLNNLGFSWISREIFGLSLFGASVLMMLIIRWFLSPPVWLEQLSIIFSTITSVYLIYAMIRLYMPPTIISWAHWNTPLSFSLSTIILGISAYSLIYINDVNHLNILIRNVTMVLFVFILFELLSSFLYYVNLKKIHILNPVNSFIKKGTYFSLFIVRSALIILILTLFVALIVINNDLSPNTSSTRILLIYIALGLILMQEIIGRYLFYNSYIRIGL